MASRLKNMVFDFVSLVPNGANQHADIVLAKRDDTEDTNELEEFVTTPEEVEKGEPSSDSVHVDRPLGSEDRPKKSKKDEEDEDYEDEEEDEEDVNKGVGTTGAYESPTLTHMNEATGLPEGLTQEAIEYIEKLEDVVLSKEDEITALLNSTTDVSKEDNVYEETLEEVSKSDPTIADLIEKYEAAEARAIEAEEIAKSERDHRINSEMIAKAQGYAHIGSVEEVAEVLKQLHEVDVELFAKVDSLLTKAEAAVSSGDLFKELGQTTESSVGADLDAVAKSLRTEDPTLTAAQAITKALELRPELYNGGN